MSLASKVVLGAAITFTVSVVSYVHVKQGLDRESMKTGVVRDVQRQEMKKRQNLKQAQDQIELTKALREQQQRAGERDDSDLKSKAT